MPTRRGSCSAISATIALVVHGPALRTLTAERAHPDIAARFQDAARDGVAMHACANTMRGMSITLGDLLPGFVAAEQGGVVKLSQLQGQGYAYLRP